MSVEAISSRLQELVQQDPENEDAVMVEPVKRNTVPNHDFFTLRVLNSGRLYLVTVEEV